MIVAEINNRISGILSDALSGEEARYRSSGHIRWGLVEREIHLTVIAGLGGRFDPDETGGNDGS